MIKIVEKEIVSTIPKDRVETKFVENESDLELSLDEYLFDLLVHQGPMTRGEICRLTKVPRTTVYDHLIKLILQDRVMRFSKSGKKPGRPKIYFKAIFP
ncbi:MAG: helix-turn-helix domain-containing protein [Promethearchaeota archaeon]